jgi:hypothetical protein
VQKEKPISRHNIPPTPMPCDVHGFEPPTLTPCDVHRFGS